MPDDNAIFACPDGHVHLELDSPSVTLEPEHVDEWIKGLYTAKKQAEEYSE